MDVRPRVVTRSERDTAPGTAGIVREAAFTADDRWIGFVRTEPGIWSGWHHHGDHETYFYVMRGSIELEVAPGEPTISAGPGDFAHVPAKLVHRERTSPGEPGEAVLVRVGRGPAVVNVDGPTG